MTNSFDEIYDKMIHSMGIRADAEFKLFKSAFEYAGIENVDLLPIKNRYWPSGLRFVDIATPWYVALIRVRSAYGGRYFRITIGKRKRVFSVEFECISNPNTVIDRDVFGRFIPEDVTFSDNMFHAWGDQDLKEYLKKTIDYIKGM